MNNNKGEVGGLKEKGGFNLLCSPEKGVIFREGGGLIEDLL